MCCRMQSRRKYNPFHNALDTSKKLFIKPWYNSSQSGQLNIFSQSNTSSGDLAEVVEGESSRTRYRTALTWTSKTLKIIKKNCQLFSQRSTNTLALIQAHS